MARTNPHHDWPEQQSAAPKSNGAEWDSLRNELVALLDQVEDHVAGVEAPPQASAQAAPSPALPHPDRHGEALKSVRLAVSRLAERGDEKPVIRDSVVEAIAQIRARQTGAASALAPKMDAQPAPSHAAPAPRAAEEPAPRPMTHSSDTAGLASSLDALGQRIGAFETQIGTRLDSFDERADISGQITQLSEVIELLANAVGETGHTRRLEAQIGNLAEMLASDRAADADVTARRMEDLTLAVEKLVAHQIEASDRDGRLAVEADERRALSMEAVERSVRSIYDRIDAIEASQAEPAYVERLSNDMAALTEAVSANREPAALLAKIDALSQRIEAMPEPGEIEGETLAHSVSVLRSVIAETIEPRFVALEDRFDTLSATGQPAEEVENQLRQIARRVEETSAQLKSLAPMPDAGAAPMPDFEALAERIVERTNALASRSASEPDAIDKADLDALEERLANLFARRDEQGTREIDHLAGVRTSIAQVDNRIARLEAMLDSRTKDAGRPEIAQADTTVQVADAPRAKPADAMPLDPVTGEHRDEVGETERPAPEQAPMTFVVDPQTVERPEKPKSSLIEDREDRFAAYAETVEPEARSAGISNATRSSFIEAARRSARQPELDAAESQSLIGRALARFHRTEAESERQTEQDRHDEPVDAQDMDEVVDLGAEREPETEARPGFIARNRRALLLGTALVAAIALAIPLVLGRAGPTPAPTATSPEAAITEPAAISDDETALADEEPVAEEVSVEVPDDVAPADGLTSAVRLIEQQSGLTAARIDAASLSAAPYLDPIQTAAIRAGEPVADAAQRASGPVPVTSASLPQIEVPEQIEPAQLRSAAEAGDRYAQFEVGAILTEGTVVEQDFSAASAWYERSAAQGFAPAQYRLGSLYESGRGVERDLEMARLWYQRAAEAGNRMSMHNLASLYAGGELETQEFSSAAHWFEQAASRGMTDSQFNLGMLNARGLGIDQDFEQSYIWFSLAARSGDQDAANSRDDIARSLDAAAIQRLDGTIEAWEPEPFDLAANFAPIGTWDEAFDPGPAVANSDVVLRVQMLLDKLGFDVGTPDGIAGPRTREAIAAFERETGMSESGAINPRLLAVLGSQPV